MPPRRWPALRLVLPAIEHAHLRDLLAARLDDFQPRALEEIPPSTWLVFFPSADLRDLAERTVRTCPELAAVSTMPEDVPDPGWAERAQADLRAIRVGGLIVAPPWDLPPSVSTAEPGLIVIEPSMGFGTGHHESTRLCLALMQEVPLRGRAVVDLGTGSGVLAIAAARLGARQVLAVDVDADAIENARANVARNALTAAIALHHGDYRALETPPADVVLANLTGADLTGGRTAITPLVGVDGHLIASGFLDAEAERVVGAFQPALGVLRRAASGDWAAAILQRA